MNETIKKSLSMKNEWIENNKEKVLKQLDKDILKAGAKGRTYLEYRSHMPGTPDCITAFMVGNIKIMAQMINENYGDDVVVMYDTHQSEYHDIQLKMDWSKSDDK
ncbi:hypothetical protein [Macrococcus equipercicus]|uniref:Uncharacterized protein n=1 Tax=Macrococcus equipercicus TaxID=69967 RepID=A0A9Q9F0X7_9STAP|nr:hypothetical protein [Macrococcus equipercicus]KAA1039144.1 hypothetical protein ERX35_007980 [Macrococcus equipercicus]UTH13317.1 hypothetical protein KFV11_08595 [Macrococcus equipercicus]